MTVPGLVGDAGDKRTKSIVFETIEGESEGG